MAEKAINECVVYTEDFRTRLHGYFSIPAQFTTVLEYANANDSISLERCRCYRRHEWEFALDADSAKLEGSPPVHISTAAIALIHGDVRSPTTTSAKTAFLKSVGSDEIPIFVDCALGPSFSTERIHGTVLARVSKGAQNVARALDDGLRAYLQGRPRFVPIRHPTNAILQKWFASEDWQDRQPPGQQPKTILLSRRLMSFYGVRMESE